MSRFIAEYTHDHLNKVRHYVEDTVTGRVYPFACRTDTVEAAYAFNYEGMEPGEFTHLSAKEYIKLILRR